MIAYHISRTDSLQEGQIISLFKYPKSDDSFSFMAETLFDGVVSQHGILYIGDVGINEHLPHLIESGIEFELELIRRGLFPNKLSRFQSFYALESLSDLSSWMPLFKNYDYHIWEIEFNHMDYEKHDASLMPHFHNYNYPYSPSLNFQWAYKYWSGESGKNPMYELLIKPPVLIKREIHQPILIPQGL